MLRIVALASLLLMLGCAQRNTLVGLADSYSELGYEYLQRDERPAARVAFREAIALEPNLAQAYLGLALGFERDGETALAEDYYRQAIHIEPQPAFAHALGQFLVRQQRLPEAAIVLQQATADVDYQGRAMAFEDLAMLRLYQTDVLQAREAFVRALTLDQSLPVPHWHLAHLALAEHEYAEAHTHYLALERLIAAGVLEHSAQTLQLGMTLSEARNDALMRQRLQHQLELIHPDQP